MMTRVFSAMLDENIMSIKFHSHLLMPNLEIQNKANMLDTIIEVIFSCLESTRNRSKNKN